GVVRNFLSDLLVERIIGATAQCGRRLVAGDREYPGGNLRTPFEMAYMLPHIEKHVARKVLGGGRVVHDPEHETVDSQMMGLHRDTLSGAATRSASRLSESSWCPLV